MTDQNNKADKPKKDSKSTEFSTKQTIGVLGGIVVLLAILFIGVSQTKPAGARLITGEEKPAEALYMEEASPVDYEDAILKEYEAGTLLELEGKVHKIFEEPLKGAQSILFNMEEETLSGESTGSIKQVILTLVSEPLDIKELQNAHVYGRYIGTLEYENTIGAREIVPAIQVDYIDLM